MTYLYLFSEGDTVHTLILLGCKTPRSAASSSRTTQLPPSPLRFRGAQDCTHEGEPLGFWLSSQRCCPAKETRGRGWTAAGYISDPGVTSNGASKQKKYLGSLVSQRVLRDDSAPARSVLGRVCVTAKGWSRCGRLPRLPSGCRLSIPSWRRCSHLAAGLHRVPGELRELRHRYLPHRHVPARGDPLLQSTERIKIPPRRWARQPLEERTKKESEKQGQWKVEIRHHLWKRFWKSFFGFQPDFFVNLWIWSFRTCYPPF